MQQTQSASVVTPDRFAQGLSFTGFLAQATVNRDKLEESYRSVPLRPEDLSFFRKVAALPDGPAKILVLAEAWCGDVCRELPTAVRIAEATGLELRIFLRDQNLDVMDEILGSGTSRAIPVIIFYTADLQYIAHFRERSASAHAGLAAAMNEARTQLNLPQSAKFGNLPDAERQVFLKNVIARVAPHVDQWRKDAIREIRDLLSVALKIPNAG
jgi:hypothetical protein